MELRKVFKIKIKYKALSRKMHSAALLFVLAVLPSSQGSVSKWQRFKDGFQQLKDEVGQLLGMADYYKTRPLPLYWTEPPQTEQQIPICPYGGISSPTLVASRAGCIAHSTNSCWFATSLWIIAKIPRLREYFRPIPIIGEIIERALRQLEDRGLQRENVETFVQELGRAVLYWEDALGRDHEIGNNILHREEVDLPDFFRLLFATMPCNMRCGIATLGIRGTLEQGDGQRFPLLMLVGADLRGVHYQTLTSNSGYRLRAIVIHIALANVGHWITCIRLSRGHWVKYDDRYSPQPIENPFREGGTIAIVFLKHPHLSDAPPLPSPPHLTSILGT
jgi:hypothetical protein